MSDDTIRFRLLEELMATKLRFEEEGYTDFAQKISDIIVQFNSEYLVNYSMEKNSKKNG